MYSVTNVSGILAAAAVLIYCARHVSSRVTRKKIKTLPYGGVCFAVSADADQFFALVVTLFTYVHGRPPPYKSEGDENGRAREYVRAEYVSVSPLSSVRSRVRAQTTYCFRPTRRISSGRRPSLLDDHGPFATLERIRRVCPPRHIAGDVAVVPRRVVVARPSNL